MLSRIKSTVIDCANTINIEIDHAILRFEKGHVFLVCSVDENDNKVKMFEKELRSRFEQFQMCKSSDQMYASNFVKVVPTKRLLILISICKKAKCGIKDIWIDKDNKLKEGMT